MTYDRVSCGFRDANICTGGITESSGGAGAILRGGGWGTVAEGERVERGAGKHIVLVAQAAAAGVATTGGCLGALETDIRMLRANQTFRTGKGLSRIWFDAAKAHVERGLVDACHIIRGLTLIAFAAHQTQLPAQCSQNCKLFAIC